MKSAHRPSEPGESPAKPADRRAFPRIPAEQLPGLSASLSPDMGLRLIDISRGGALFECRKRIVPGSEVALRLVTQDGSHVVRGRVVRSRMIRLEDGAMGYQTAIAFNETLKDLPTPTTAETAAAEGAAAATSDPDPHAAPAAEPEDVRPANRDALETDESWLVTPLILLTASIAGTSAELRELFTTNDW
jgi:hypothetical protein